MAGKWIPKGAHDNCQDGILDIHLVPVFDLYFQFLNHYFNYDVHGVIVYNKFENEEQILSWDILGPYQFGDHVFYLKKKNLLEVRDIELKKDDWWFELRPTFRGLWAYHLLSTTYKSIPLP